MVVDNYYTNIQLTEILLDNNSHFVGTLRQNVKYAPKQILAQNKMKRGEIIGRENRNGIVIANWKGKRNIRFITM